MDLKKVKYLLWSLGLAVILVIAVMAIATYCFHSWPLVVVSLVLLLCLCAAGIAISVTLWRCPYCGEHLGRGYGKYCSHCGRHLVDLE